ncbi:MAG: hypothetical protein OXG35_33510 [Acidobacteria bacterium]|nr:hypothetical protein [Acidobacteriota bacterium]
MAQVVAQFMREGPAAASLNAEIETCSRRTRPRTALGLHRTFLLGRQAGPLGVTVALVVAAGELLLASLVRVMQVEQRFEPASVVAVDLNLPGSRYDPAGERSATTASSRG